MLKRIQIGYVMESPAPAYAKAVRKAGSKEELVKAIDFFMPIVPDALKQAKAMTDKDFKDFQRDIQKAGRNQKEEWVKTFVARFGNVAAPSKMMMVDMMEAKFHAPWGVCFIRYEEMNKKKK